jgi:hypothetical protein
MSIEISQETEARLAAEARRLGISVDALLARFISEHAALTKPAQPAAACRSGISAEQALSTGETSTPMSVEPGIIDTNVLVYALDADAPQHAAARACWKPRAQMRRQPFL